MSDPQKPKLFSPKAGSRGMDELQFAAYCGDAEAVRHFLAQGADVKAADNFGYTALHWNIRMACASGDRVKIVDLLVAAGSNVNHIDNSGNTVLDSAIEATAREELTARLRSFGAVTAANR